MKRNMNSCDCVTFNIKMDLDSMSEVLSVSKPVLMRLRDVTKDEFHSYVDNQKNLSFWDKIDSLPQEIASELHQMQLQIPTDSKDFPEDCLTPSLENFFFANNGEHLDQIQLTAEIEGKTPNEQPSVSEWYSSRVQSLVEEGLKPINDQCNYSLSSSVLAARSGVSSDHSSSKSDFEQGSISELLFTDSNDGSAYPLPFMNATCDVPKTTDPNFVKFATRKFVAQALMDLKYKSSQMICLDILTDYLLNELQEISMISATKYNTSHKAESGQSTPPDAKSVVMQTLRSLKYDVRTSSLSTN